MGNANNVIPPMNAINDSAENDRPTTQPHLTQHARPIQVTSFIGRRNTMSFQVVQLL